MCTVTASGTGGNAANGTADTASDTEAFTVNAVVALPDAVAPSVAVGAVGNVNEGATQQFTRALSGGTYDELDEAWSVISGSGSVNSSGLYTAPQVSFNTTGQVRLTVTARGTGGIAQDGTSAQASDADDLADIHSDGRSRLARRGCSCGGGWRRGQR